MSPSPTAAPAIELIGIDKKFGTVHANKNINLTVAKGSIHGIIDGSIKVHDYMSDNACPM